MRLSILLFFLFCSFHSFSQDDSLSLYDFAQGQALPYTYLFQLNDQQADLLYRKGVSEVDESFFTKLVEIDTTNNLFVESYKSQLSVGHYITVNLKESQISYSLFTVNNCQLFVINNEKNLLLNITDESNQVINNAKVRLKGKRIRFDNKSQAFQKKRCRPHGLLTVKYEGFTNYYNLHEKYSPKTFRAKFRHFAYSFPLKYIFLPLRFIIKFPFDSYESIRRGHPRGTVRYTKLKFEKLSSKIRCAINEDYCHHPYISYMVLSKPKYRSGDTIKLKAHVLDYKYRSINDSLTLHIEGRWINGKQKWQKLELAKLGSSSPGSYEYSFVVPRDIKLKGENNYILHLKNNYESIKSAAFMYQAYELKSVHLELETPKKIQTRNVEFPLTIKTFDENDLPILDGELSLKLTCTRINSYLDSVVYVPTTLWTKKMDAKASGETEIVIPDSIFPAADLSYKLEVRLQTAESETLDKSLNIKFENKTEDVKFHLNKDTLFVNYTQDHVEKVVEGMLEWDSNGIHHVEEFKTSDYRIIDPRTINYLFKYNKKYYNYFLSVENSLVQFQSTIDSDTLSFSVHNPRNINISYFIYKGNKEIYRSFGPQLDFSLADPDTDNYYLSVLYVWGGRVISNNYLASNSKYNIQLELDHPAHIYPGEEVNIKVKALDYRKEAIPGLNITAYSLTNKFDYKIPRFPRYTEKNDVKTIRKWFSLKSIRAKASMEMDFHKWKEIAGLDSVEFYDFLYPKSGLYSQTFPTKDSLTQFSAFAFEKGVAEDVQIIYLDNIPVYFGWSDNERPYSFACIPGKHKIAIRTTNKYIEIKNVIIEPHRKTIISVDLNKKHKSVKYNDEKPELSSREKRRIYPYILNLGRSNFKSNSPKFIIDIDTNYIFNLPPYSVKGDLLVGPVPQSLLSFNDYQHFDQAFTNEKNYRHEFRKNFLKLTSLPETNGKPRNYKNLLHSKKDLVVGDQVFSKDDLRQSLQNYKLNQRRDFILNRYRSRTIVKGRGNLIFDAPFSVINCVLVRQDTSEFLKIYEGKRRKIQNLNPGYYKLILLYPDQKNQTFDSLLVQADGRNYYNLHYTKDQSRNRESIKLDSLVNKIYQEGFHNLPYSNKYHQELRNSVIGLSEFEGDGILLFGNILDSNDQPVIGANIIVEGTTIGTISDLDGNYNFIVPKDSKEIVFSYTGYASQAFTPEMLVFNNSIVMRENHILDEVVITGYKVPLIDMDMTSSTITVSALGGKSTGVKLTQSKAVGLSNISIRGSRSASTNYYVDGIKVTNTSLLPSSNDIRFIEVVTGKEAEAVYGVTEVVLISTNQAFINQELDPQRGTSIRSNFSDEGFWKPTLITDENGEASFTVTFPDDITKWDVFLMAMNEDRLSGKAQTSIQSFKPLSAGLSVPKFMIRGDQARAVAKLRNYRSDTTVVKTTKKINDQLVSSEVIAVSASYIDSISFTAGAKDSVKLEYSLSLDSGYTDGEIHYIPVLPKGMEKVDGEFYLLDVDTSFSIKTDSFRNEVVVYGQGNDLQLARSEIDHIRKYRYYCNEQLASKLLALLNAKKICQMLGEEFMYVDEVNKLIRLLEKRYKKESLWGWWDENYFSPWISHHVLRSLLKAHSAGFEINMDLKELALTLAWKIDEEKNLDQQLCLLEMSILIDSSYNYSAFTARWDSLKNISLHHRLRISELNSRNGVKDDTDYILNYMHETMLGEAYIEDKSAKTNWRIRNNKVLNTRLAYKILRRQNTEKYKEMLSKLKLYFLKNRVNGHWRNTYESILIVETLVDDFTLASDKDIKPFEPISLEFSGTIEKKIDTFPFELKYSPGDIIDVKKNGFSPVYLTAYSRYWSENISRRENDFIVNTEIADSKELTMTGVQKKEVDLIAKLKVKKEAEYVMIEIPIPAGCYYTKKTRARYPETHREYLDDKVLIFCHKLNAGDYTFSVPLMNRFTGTYQINPAKVSLMYFPTFYANEDTKTLEILK